MNSSFETVQSVPAPANDYEIDPLTVAFRPIRVFSKQLLVTLFFILVGASLGASANHAAILQNRRALIGVGIYLAVIIAIIVGIRVFIWVRGGVPPIRFCPDDVELPANVNSRKTIAVPYMDILSLTCVGKGKRARLILDTKKRAFVYPVQRFIDPDAPAIIADALRQRISARPGGALQWQNMQERQKLGKHLATFKAWITWSICALLAVIFIGTHFLTAHNDDDLFPLIDFGANASFLVFGGEWYRLVAANFLHLNFMHLYFNLISTFVIGSLVERQLGKRRFIFLVLTTGILSQLTSALWAHLGWFSNVVYSVGFSGTIFGLLGAQAVLNRRFGRTLPGGYRFAARSWWILLGLNFGVIPIAFPQVDSAAHIGGFVSGILIGWLLCRRQTEIDKAPSFSVGNNVVLAGAAAVWVVGIGLTINNVLNSMIRQDEHTALIAHLLELPHPKPAIDNAFAWSIAIDPAATADGLTDAQTLVERAISTETEKAGANSKDIREFTDTLATLRYRLGAYQDAVTLEAPLLYGAAVSGAPSQMARFLQADFRQHGVRTVGETQALPQLTLHTSLVDAWTFDLSVATSLPRGADIYALLHIGDQILGLLQLNVEPTQGDAHVQVLSNLGAPQNVMYVAAPAANKTELTIVQIDSSGCHCAGRDVLRRQFFAYDNKVAALP